MVFGLSILKIWKMPNFTLLVCHTPTKVKQLYTYSFKQNAVQSYGWFSRICHIALTFRQSSFSEDGPSSLAIAVLGQFSLQSLFFILWNWPCQRFRGCSPWWQWYLHRSQRNQLTELIAWFFFFLIPNRGWQKKLALIISCWQKRGQQQQVSAGQSQIIIDTYQQKSLSKLVGLFFFFSFFSGKQGIRWAFAAS